MVEFWNEYGLPTAITVAYIVGIVIVLLGAVAYLTLAELHARRAGLCLGGGPARF